MATARFIRLHTAEDDGTGTTSWWLYSADLDRAGQTNEFPGRPVQAYIKVRVMDLDPAVVGQLQNGQAVEFDTAVYPLHVSPKITKRMTEELKATIPPGTLPEYYK